MADTTLIDSLRATRDDYMAEVAWGRFLLDAYCGTGGFAGRVVPPAISQIGWVAEAYGVNQPNSLALEGRTESTSYLDQYPREDISKYVKRCEVAHFSNYVETIFDLLVSYALKRPSTVEDLPDSVSKWRQNVTVYGASWEMVLRESIARRSGLLGWCPVLVDQLTRGEGLSEAQVREQLGRVEPFLTPLTPANILDWYVDELGVLKWIKIKLTYKRHADALAKPTKVDVYKIYDASTVRSWDVVDDKVENITNANHPFGRVPLVSFQHKPHLEERLRGVSMVGDAAIASRRLFNLDSELDEHIRSNVFAILQVPIPTGADMPSEILGGNGMGLPLPADSRQKYEYLAPPASVAETLETRIENTTREIFRRARVQFKQSGGAQQSGISKQWDFEETNRLLADFASHLARAEREVYQVIARVMGSDAASIENIRVLPPTSFAVEDLVAEIDNATKALAMNLGATASKLVKNRVASRLLENVSSDDAKQIESELEAASKLPPPAVVVPGAPKPPAPPTEAPVKPADQAA